MHKRIKKGLRHSFTLENEMHRTLFLPKVDFFFSFTFMDKNTRPKREESEGQTCQALAALARPRTSVCRVSSTTQQNANCHPGFDLL